MTPRQRETLSHVHMAVTVWGYPPSMAELATMLGVSSLNTVHGLLGSLEAQGLIAREPGKARTLRLTEQGYAALAGEG